MKRASSLLAGLLLAAAFHAESALYAVSLRGPGGALGGKLYKVNEADGTAIAVSGFDLDGEPIGLRGIAIHPRTRVFYGITAGLNRAVAASLVTLDPRTGKATLVGRLGHLGSDLNFDAAGTLYVWLTELNQLGVVNVGTGQVTPLSASGLTETIGGGFAIRDDNAAVISATSGAGTLDHVDLHSGRVTTGPALHGAPYVSAIVAMDYSRDRQLYAVNTNLGNPASAVLVKIDPQSGNVTRIGALPDDATAISFGDDDDVAVPLANTARIGMPLLVGVAAVVLVLGFAAGFAAGSRRARSR